MSMVKFSPIALNFRYDFVLLVHFWGGNPVYKSSAAPSPATMSQSSASTTEPLKFWKMWTLLLLSGCPCCLNLRSSRMNKAVYVSVVLCLCQHHVCTSYTAQASCPLRAEPRETVNLVIRYILVFFFPILLLFVFVNTSCPSYPAALASCPVEAGGRQVAQILLSRSWVAFILRVSKNNQKVSFIENDA